MNENDALDLANRLHDEAFARKSNLLEQAADQIVRLVHSERRAHVALAEVWDEGHEQGYDSGLYAREDDEPETVETRSLQENPYRADAVSRATV